MKQKITGLALIIFMLTFIATAIYTGREKKPPPSVAEAPITPAEMQKRDAAEQAKAGPNARPGPGAWAAAFSYNHLHYGGKITVPKSRRLEIKYADLFPGERTRGGCQWTDETQFGAPLPLLEHDAKHEVIGGTQGHLIEWYCDWITPKEEVKK
jgi:hypothetical protein